MKLDPEVEQQLIGSIRRFFAEELEEDLAPLRERVRELSEKASGLREQHRALRPQLGELETRDEARIQGLRDQ